jgi:hypothetical protein
VTLREVMNMESTGYWIIVGSPENFERTREQGFTIQGIKSRHRKKAELMRPGEKIAYYLTGVKAFAGTATIASEYFEGHDRIWASGDPKKQAEDYPFRVKIEPDVVLSPGEYVPAEPIARQMLYVRKWPADNWTLAFQGNVHFIESSDYDLIRQALLERTGAVTT